MKTFKETDNLSDMRAGDILELADGTRHEAVKGRDECFSCSLALSHVCVKWMTQCDRFGFYFKQLPNEQK